MKMREAVMKRLFAMVWLVSSLAAGTAWAQPYKPNEAGVTMGHWHLNSANIEANKKIFLGMGGAAGPVGPLQRVIFPGNMVILNLGGGPNVPAATGPSVGSVVNHVGFVVPNVQDAVAKWKAAGVPVLPGNNNRLDQAYVVTPDGLRIEILEDKNQTIPIRNEHVHFFLPEAAIPQSQAWYAKIFGAKPSARAGAPVADLPGVQLRFAKADQPQVTTKGRILDHIGFDISDLQGFIQKTLEPNGIKLDRPYTKNDAGVGLAFITDPWGTYIELNERPGAVYIN
jgi:catechol 2,3-dioxygenase-like lactoylglutathione lyase family enzyme